MSGQIVGEVLDAAEAGVLDALSSNAFQALIAVAEKASTATRQGTVRMDRIAASIRVDRRAGGSTLASRSTAERAVREVKSAGWVRVVKRGFNNGHGKACAPIYEVSAFPSHRVTETVRGVSVTLGDGNGRGTVSVNEGSVSVILGTVPVTQGDVLDGSIDGSIDGGRVRECQPAPTTATSDPNAPNPNQSANSKPATPTPTLPGNDPPEGHPERFGHAVPAVTGLPPTNEELARAAKLPDVHPDDRLAFAEPEPSRHCPDHPDDTTDRCTPCQRARTAFPEKHDDWQARRQADATAAAVNRSAWRDMCRECDEAGWEFDADGVVPADEARRCHHPRLRSARATHHARYTSPKPGKAAAS